MTVDLAEVKLLTGFLKQNDAIVRHVVDKLYVIKHPSTCEHEKMFERLRSSQHEFNDFSTPRRNEVVMDKIYLVKQITGVYARGLVLSMTDIVLYRIWYIDYDTYDVVSLSRIKLTELFEDIYPIYQLCEIQLTTVIQNAAAVFHRYASTLENCDNVNGEDSITGINCFQYNSETRKKTTVYINASMFSHEHVSASDSASPSESHQNFKLLCSNDQSPPSSSNVDLSTPLSSANVVKEVIINAKDGKNDMNEKENAAKKDEAEYTSAESLSTSASSDESYINPPQSFAGVDLSNGDLVLRNKEIVCKNIDDFNNDVIGEYADEKYIKEEEAEYTEPDITSSESNY